ncbi:hypothetical protein Zmor_026795 [Zophobas morio]|uniref:C2H2-type domain-containing protein n=1 Tax=Zophobas morio TaxID=2755281 RepID=A0AA38M689_9CUCU|nr:hypothetical protein Zmor_026795 [Zophobas morio]
MSTVGDSNGFPRVTFSLKNRLLLHIINHFERRRSLSYPFDCETANIENYYCNYCNFETELVLVFKQHLEEHQGVKRSHRDVLIGKHRIRTYVCEKCGFETNFLMKWRQHTKQCIGKEKSLQMYRCDECGSMYKQKPSLKENTILKHLNDDKIQWYHCANCPYKAKPIIVTMDNSESEPPETEKSHNKFE